MSKENNEFFLYRRIATVQNMSALSVVMSEVDWKVLGVKFVQCKKVVAIVQPVSACKSQYVSTVLRGSTKGE